MLYDFDSVVLNISDLAYSGEQSLEGFDLNTMLGEMGISEGDIKKLGITSLPVYFYAQTPADDKSALGNLLGGIGQLKFVVFKSGCKRHVYIVVNGFVQSRKIY